ncbi:hybrid sensor histidine kinase/response regulator transcription factor [Mucilaginibacter sp. FT3.2]|uniref:hybrid sensor histidine kinase/response regulator transcription factor n=1 Tax=Mucilaginibacter sp. FT3.2 TaxID=2723090 RepID=UPI00160A8668|nr:two-component regulator propeller domain-containing protein [Mucilaginibacter sp. FT3.2]MBB6234936.1 ligand-binding sensor domain-containing protein/signal transduction histidine kinase/AraC-like DNA-binding protein/FixJ family two-component response regulator [Mucilaginibacter sp. FT3.2]
MKLGVAVFLYFIFLALSSYSQRIVFENLTADDGLSQNSVLAIAQDSRGFMWYGTQHGLNKYDTRTFKIYNNDPDVRTSLSSDYITSLLVDSHGVLWVGTRNGLNRYNPETDNFERINLGRLQVPNNQVISCIYEDRKKSLWIWCTEGLKRLENRATNKFITVQIPNVAAGLYGNNTHAIYQDHLGIYWLGSSSGLTQMTRQQTGFAFKMYQQKADRQNSLSDNYVTAINEDTIGNLWIGTLHGGVNLYKRSNNTFTRFVSNTGMNGPVNNNIRILSADRTGKMWIGTQAGLNILDPVTRQFVSYRHDPENKNSLSQNSIYSIFIDRDNTVWIGTYWGGINMVPSHSNTFLTFQTARYHSAINNNVVSAVTEDALSNLWIGTEGGGLNYFDRKTDEVTTYQNKVNDAFSLGSDLVKVIYIDKNRHVWVGTHGGGLNLFNPATHNFTRYLYRENDPVTLGSEVLNIFEDSKNNFWIGTQNGLLAFRRNNTELQHTDAPLEGKIGRKSINALLEDKDHNFWIGTNRGLFVVWHASGQMQIFKSLNNKTPLSVNTLHVDNRNRLWVGSYYGGLAMYNKGQMSFAVYTEKEGLANNNVLGILEDEGNLWVSTSNGLSRFNIASKNFKNYTKNDGLGGNTFNINSCYNASDNEMLFGGFNGLTSFFPSQVKDNNIAPPVIITTLKLFNKPAPIGPDGKILTKDISLTHDIVFSHSQNVFTIDFAALNYIKSEKNRYAYKLENFNKDWIYTGIPSASYTNVPPGDYIFRAKGTNNDGVWGQAAVLHVKVMPPFWETAWAYALYILVVGGLIFFIARFFILRSLLRRDKELTHLKLNFFTNISHEIRTHLSLILGPVEKLILNGEIGGANAKQLQMVKKQSDNLLQLVNELMDFRKAETGNLKLHFVEGNIVGVVSEIFNSFYDHAVSRNITTSFSASSNEIRLYFDQEQIEKVFYNLIYNAFKFTGSNGSVNILIEEKKDEVTVIITDTGKGIAAENLKHLFENYFQEDDNGQQNTGYGIGLALAKSISELHGGTIEVESKLSLSGNRTSFTLTLVKGANHFSQTQLGKSSLNYSPVAHKTFDITENEIFPLINFHRSKDKKYLILLVEDNPDVRFFIRETLENYYDIIESINGGAGWKCAVEHIPDLIICDVMMPEMDGFTLCNKLKTDERTNHIPTILLTAKASAPNHVNGLKKGADVYLTKPFSIEILFLQIENLLNARKRIRDHYHQQLKINYTNTGFIPLSRLDNDNEAKSLLNSFDDEFLCRVIKIIEEHLDDEEFGVPILAQIVAMSQPVLYKKLNALTGMSVNDFIKSIKMNRATILLQSKRYTINEIAYMLGFSDRKYFSKEFKKLYGKNPSEFVD